MFLFYVIPGEFCMEQNYKYQSKAFAFQFVFKIGECVCVFMCVCVCVSFCKCVCQSVCECVPVRVGARACV